MDFALGDSWGLVTLKLGGGTSKGGTGGALVNECTDAAELGWDLGRDVVGLAFREDDLMPAGKAATGR